MAEDSLTLFLSRVFGDSRDYKLKAVVLRAMPTLGA